MRIDEELSAVRRREIVEMEWWKGGKGKGRCDRPIAGWGRKEEGGMGGSFMEDGWVSQVGMPARTWGGLGCSEI